MVRRHLLKLALGASLFLGGAHSTWAESVTLTPEEMRNAAALSLDTANPAQALALAEALLARDPEDIEALVLKSRAQRDLGGYDAALETAKKANSLAERDEETYAAALARAQALSSLGARTRAQYWLRVASQNAPNDAARDRAIRDFKYVRSRNPWNTQLSFSVAPTSNVNDGSVHDKISYGGLQGIVLSGSAQALSGVSWSGGVTTRYRFSESETHQTDIGLHLFGQTYTLSDEAKEIAPDAKGSDFAYSSVAVGLRHLWRPESWTTPLEVSLLYGRGWYGGQDYSRYTRSAIARPFVLGEDTQLRFSAGGEHFYRITDGATQRSLHAGATLLHEFDNGADLRFSLGVKDSNSETGSLDYTRVLGNIGYTLPQKIAMARTTLELGLEKQTYDNFPTLDTRGFFIVYTEKERVDLSGSVGVRFVFDDVDYYGFSPTMAVLYSETRSTDDRYDTVDAGVNFGFQSNF
ncbi:surface lipoprotein assembly modifier [Tropicimonas sp. IMCC6043]|uniref:surface lipoprotein assembly modifier n=1 Tax=Tropicimonas sp. IMCC6043 TaxID=2510645 RepID=UPI00101C3976|nr:surface lipoprotein assembly modifier [Tropicimonas sp. IMCC6043]RYH10131.1 DUF560 domain-containing protein [Tropicimonas sp. IMCC6043]